MHVEVLQHLIVRGDAGSAAERYAGISSSDSSQDMEGPAEAGVTGDHDEPVADTCESRWVSWSENYAV